MAGRLRGRSSISGPARPSARHTAGTTAVPVIDLPEDYHFVKALRLLTGLLLLRNSGLEEPKRDCHLPHLTPAEIAGIMHGFRCDRRRATSPSKSYHTVQYCASMWPHTYAVDGPRGI